MKIASIAALILLILAGVYFFRPQTEEKNIEITRNTETQQPQTDVSGAPSPSGELKSYTLEEIAVHKTPEDCWMAIEGKVYDATKAIPGHPGGKAITFGCGKEATKMFNERNGKGPHGEKARTGLENFYIGELSK